MLTCVIVLWLVVFFLDKIAMTTASVVVKERVAVFHYPWLSAATGSSFDIANIYYLVFRQHVLSCF